MPLIVTELLRSMDIFEELPVDDIEQIAALLTEERVPDASLLFSQGDPGDAMYIVTGGRIKLFTSDESGIEKVLTHFGDGDFFGEMALLTGAPRSASAQAVQDSRLLVLRKEVFDRYVAANPVVMREMLKVVSKRQTATNVRLAQDEEAERTGVGAGKVYVIYGPRGGSGKTTVAINTAVALAQQHSDRVALLDLDLTFGHAAMMLRLSPASSLADLPPESLRTLDRENLNRYLLRHSSGLRVFVGANKPEEGEAVTGEHVKAALEVMKRQFLYIVVDTSSSFAEPILAALEMADKIVLLCTPELNSVRDVRECQRIFSDVIRVSKEKLVYVMNQYQPFRVLAKEQFEHALEVQLLSDIPHAGEAGFKAVEQGQPLYLGGASGSVLKAIEKLAGGLQNESANGVVKGPRTKPAGRGLSLFQARAKKPPPRPASGGAPSTHAVAAAPPAASTYPVDLAVTYSGKSSRLLTLLRLPLTLAHMVVASVLIVLAWFAAIPCWFAILFTGRMPRPLFQFISNAVRVFGLAFAYGSLLTDQFPPLSGNPSWARVASYPVQVAVPYIEHRARVSVLLRALLLIPHYFFSIVYFAVFAVVSFLAWLLVLIRGTFPPRLFQLVLGLNRYSLRVLAYGFLLVDKFPPVGLKP